MKDPRTLVTESIDDETCLLLVLSKKRRNAVNDLDKVTLRPVVIAGERKYQITFQSAGRQSFENVDAPEATDRFQFLFGQQFEHCHLFTTEADYTLRARRGGAITVKRKPPSRQSEPLEHDREKNYLIPDGVPCPFLVEIGVMAANGRVKAAKQHKFRQINRFMELVDDIIGHLPAEGVLNVVDFGCGKSSLTFALHHLLTAIHKRTVHIVGLDRNADVVANSERIARRLGCPGLKFVQRDIAEYETDRPVHLVVSLHACDTATDGALAKAIAWKTDVILAVPCCQHELSQTVRHDAFEPLHRHGILHERFAALATDALRAEVLELCGYKTQVVEFIDLEHTAKNLLIRGVRRAASQPDDMASGQAHSYDRFLRALGLKDSCLERLLGEAFPRQASATERGGQDGMAIAVTDDGPV